VPPLVANGRVYVATWSNQVAVYGLLVPPAVTGISPGSGTTDGGTSVTLTGKNFVAGATVNFGGAAAVVTSVNAATITAKTPAHKPGSVNVVVKNPDGQSGTLASAFIYRKHG
jgi:large repetitive protein